jgi:hypothetical protein
VGFVVDKVALGRFSPSTSVSPADIIPPLLHIHLSPPHEVCDCSDQASHYHNLGPQLGASLLTRHIGWKQKKKVKESVNHSLAIFEIVVKILKMKKKHSKYLSILLLIYKFTVKP